jgi:hypothetical protein
MRVNRFADWVARTGQAAKTGVTGVTGVTPLSSPRISAALASSKAVTPAAEPGVTGVTGTATPDPDAGTGDASQTSPRDAVTPVTPRPNAGVTGKHEEYQSCSARYTCYTENQATSGDDDFEERAALIEEGSGAPREWAEAFAGIDAGHPPEGIPEPRWRQFIDDGGRFLDQGWAYKAKALGWSPLELFGCDRSRPLARIDNTGLIWLMRGRRLLALTAETATIENRNAPPHKYRRCLNEPGRAVLAWELLS